MGQEASGHENRMVPCTLLTGFLGAGKTTLLWVYGGTVRVRGVRSHAAWWGGACTLGQAPLGHGAPLAHTT